jgi:hypothetical protein
MPAQFTGEGSTVAEAKADCIAKAKAAGLPVAEVDREYLNQHGVPTIPQGGVS